jgi:hypothetical protein
MKSVYVVRAIPVRNVAGEVAGWVHPDVFADGTRPTDGVILRDGSMCRQAEALERISADRSLLYMTEAEAVRDGIDRPRELDGEKPGDNEECDCTDCINEQSHWVGRNALRSGRERSGSGCVSGDERIVRPPRRNVPFVGAAIGGRQPCQQLRLGVDVEAIEDLR